MEQTDIKMPCLDEAKLFVARSKVFCGLSSFVRAVLNNNSQYSLIANN